MGAAPGHIWAPDTAAEPPVPPAVPHVTASPASTGVFGWALARPGKPQPCLMARVFFLFVVSGSTGDVGASCAKQALKPSGASLGLLAALFVFRGCLTHVLQSSGNHLVPGI